MAKKKYFPNNWQAYKDSPDDLFFDHGFEEFMNWKIGGWELPSSVACIIRVKEKKKVKEYVYESSYHAMNKVGKLMDAGLEFTIVDSDAVHHMEPKLK